MIGGADKLQDLWRQLSQRFGVLSRRERGTVAAALMIGGGLLIYMLVLEPPLIKVQAANKAAATARIELARQQAQLAVLKAQNADPDARSKQRLSQARDQRKLLSERLAAFEAGMVPPSRMQAFLEGLLAKNRNLELLELKTLPAEQVGATLGEAKTGTLAQTAQLVRDPGKALTVARDAATKADPGASSEGIYQHGVEIRLAGGYNDLVNYLAELEQMPQQVMWSSVRLEVIRYPRNEMTVRVYTLSLDRNWLVM
jgi:MSHA biogenesis protein MshJ